MNKGNANKSLCFNLALMLTSMFLLSCVSNREWTTDAQPEHVRNSIAELHRRCRLKPKSGFSADLVISGQGTARIEAIWDSQREIQGQILNPIGEDLLNFKIDSSGLQLVDQSVRAPDDVLTALDFLAQMGTGEARSLLCSGLLFAEKNLEQKDPPSVELKTAREIELQGKNLWSLASKVEFRSSENDKSRPEMRITTEISRPVLFWKKRVATVDWRPGALSIQTQQLDVRLSFLDFE
ncbi:MAG: hypothetical protein FJY29_09480 [Betaproteobacteria bacterium]|nr:hypothetical protein [Betaproteobacteria bacterium]